MNTLNQKSLLTLPAFLLMAFSSYANDVDRSLDWTDGGELIVDITSGQVEIRGWNKNEVKLTGDYSGDEDRLVFKSSGKNIKIKVKDEGRGWWGGNSAGSADFVVFTPFDSDLDIEGTSLSVEVSEINGRIDVNTVSGSVKVEGNAERIDVQSVSGDIDVKGAKGNTRLQTVSGDVDAEVEALNFEGKSISGDVQGKIGQVEYASLTSVSGDIDIELTLGRDGRVEGQTVSGNVELNFDKRPNADFELHTGPGGDIRNRISDDKPDDDSHWGQELRFTVGDGEGNVELETMSGTIRIE